MFHDLGYAELEKRSLALKSSFASVKSAFDLYHLHASKTNDGTCSPHILKVTHLHTESNEFDLERPQVNVYST